MIRSMNFTFFFASREIQVMVETLEMMVYLANKEPMVSMGQEVTPEDQDPLVSQDRLVPMANLVPL